MKTTSAPSRTARWTVWPVASRRSVMTGKRELAKPAWLFDGLPELEEAHAEIEHVAIAVEETLPDEVGRDPRDRRLRQVRAPGQLRDAEPFVVFSEGLEDGRHPVEHADRFGPIRGAHVARQP